MNGTTTVLAEPGRLETREYQLPDPPAGGALVEMERANVCGSEVHMFRGHHPVITPGRVLGHEGVGRIARIGAGLTTDNAGQPLAEGDRVVASYFQTCRHCAACQNGATNLCARGNSVWAQPAEEPPHFFGTFGTHWIVTAHQNIYKVPEAVSSIAVSSANCALSQVVYALDGMRSGTSIVILGAGGLGLCAAATAAHAGAHVTIAEADPRRLGKARAFGAHTLVDLSSADSAAERIDLLRDSIGRGADVVVDVTGAPSAFVEGLAAVRPAGRMISIGNVSPGRTIDFDPGLFTRSGVTIAAYLRYPPEYLGAAVALIEATPHIPWAELVDKDYALADAASAIAAAEARTVTRAGLIISQN